MVGSEVSITDRILIVHILNRQSEIKRRAFLGRGFGPNLAFVTVNDAADNRETNARPAEFVFAVQALENAEKLAGKAHVEANSIVAHEIDRLAVLSFATDFDDGDGAVAAVFDCVG